MTAPSLSVVVPCRNERATLEDCLGALLDQDLARERYEVIVVDGGSTDGSRELALRRGVRLLTDGQHGPSGARNIGIRSAQAPIVAFTDADCVPRRDWLTSIAEVFAEDQSVAGVAGALRMPRGTLLGRLEDMEAQAYYRGVITSNVAYRRDVLLEIGGFDEALKCAEDHDLARRVQAAGHRVVHDRRPVVVHQPPEVSGPLSLYLKKQFWYARHDVPANVRGLFPATRREAGGAAEAARSFATALRDAALTLGITTGALARSSATLLGGAGALALAANRVATAARLCADAPTSELPAMVAIVAARSVTRGAGTLVGLAELAFPGPRALLTAARAPFGPAAPSRAREPAPLAQRAAR